MTASSRTTPKLHVKLLGGASLVAAPRSRGPTPANHTRTEEPISVPRLEKRTAAVLAYLALEGPTARSRIAGLLWPDSKEVTARNNLAQTLRRLKTSAGTVIVDGDAALALRDVSVDVVELLGLVDRGAFAEAATLPWELLPGLDFDECPDFRPWLEGARVRVRRAWTKAAEAEIARARGAADFDAAIAVAERVVASDPLVETAHLELAKLWLEKGDAPAAMNAYERCRKVLARELSMKPSAAMIEVFRAIREGAPTKSATREASPRRAALPANVLRPRWLGRSREWEALEDAASNHRAAVVEGEAGVGKSRLVRDFVERRGAALIAEGRPGDADVPFSTLARSLRTILSGARASAADALPGWARAELSRVLPELAERADVPVASVRGKLRFFEAVATAIESAASGAAPLSLVLDDLQWFDSASVEVFGWIVDRASSSAMFIVAAHRAGELQEEARELLDRADAAGTLARIRLGPLEREEIVALVRSLGIAAADARAAAIAEASRGVPLFALEIVRSIAEADAAAERDALAIPERVVSLTKRRIERLSEGALRLARVMVISGAEFDLELGAHVLSKDVFDLVEPLAELEREQIAEGKRLSHDLVAEAVREGLPSLVREHIHAKTAERLIATRADPARIAQHLEAGGRSTEAAPYLVRAAMTARTMSRISDAISLFDRAARIYENIGDAKAASEALYHRSRSHMGEEADEIVARLERLATTGGERGRALCTKANVALERGLLEQARDAAREAHPLARDAGDRLVETEAIQAWLDADIRSGRVDEALSAFAAFSAASVALSDDPEAHAAVLFYEAELYALRDMHREAIAKFAEVDAYIEKWGQLPHGRGGIMAVGARSQLALGDVAAAQAMLDHARRLIPEGMGATQAEAHLSLSRGMLHLARGEGDAAIAAVEGIRSPRFELRMEFAARVVAAEARLLSGESAAASSELDEIARDERADARTRATAALARLRAPAPAEAALVAIVEQFGSPSQVKSARNANARR